MLIVNKTKKDRGYSTSITVIDQSQFTIGHDIENNIVHVTFYNYGKYTIEHYHDTELNNEILTTENWKKHPVVLWIGEDTIYCPSVELAIEIVNGLENIK
jgi:hypothetical protein